MRIGLVGFAGSGKTTLFRALAGGRAAGDVAAVPHDTDERFLFLAEMEGSKKRTPATIELHDYPGLTPPGEERGAFRASAVRDEVEALLLVVRDFATDAYYYPRPEPDPAADVRDLVTELVLADLTLAEQRVEKLEASVRKPTPRQEQEKRELALMERVRDHLSAELPLKSADLAPDEDRVVRTYGFLTRKPWVLLVSASEGGGGAPEVPEGLFEDRLRIPVRLEGELMELDPGDREEFAREMEVSALLLPGLVPRLIDAAGMIRFYTASDREVRVWELPRGADALAAAGRIHTDIARGFIRAEVIAFEDLRAAGSRKAAREAGHQRLEGREYVVRDGDVLNIRFSV